MHALIDMVTHLVSECRKPQLLNVPDSILITLHWEPRVVFLLFC